MPCRKLFDKISGEDKQAEEGVGGAFEGFLVSRSRSAKRGKPCATGSKKGMGSEPKVRCPVGRG